MLASSGVCRDGAPSGARAVPALVDSDTLLLDRATNRHHSLFLAFCEDMRELAARMFPAGPAMFYPVYRAPRRHGCVQLLLWIWRIRLASAAASIIPCMPAPLRPLPSISCVRQGCTGPKKRTGQASQIWYNVLEPVVR